MSRRQSRTSIVETVVISRWPVAATLCVIVFIAGFLVIPHVPLPRQIPFCVLDQPPHRSLEVDHRRAALLVAFAPLHAAARADQTAEGLGRRVRQAVVGACDGFGVDYCTTD